MSVSKSRGSIWDDDRVGGQRLLGQRLALFTSFARGIVRHGIPPWLLCSRVSMM